MGLFSFLRDVGAKLSGHGGAYSAPTPEALSDELKRLGPPAGKGSLKVEGDTLPPPGQGPGGSMFYTVQKGDTLSAIAKKHYGDANAYNSIFEANRPMLDHPDRIYPG